MSKQPSTPYGEAHTPGPWYVHAPEPRLPFYVTTDCKSYQNGEVAVLYGKDSGADARLIAAAPDLLAIVEEILDLKPGDLIQDEDIARARDAVKKARGQ